jgi:hypothetical protein
VSALTDLSYNRGPLKVLNDLLGVDTSLTLPDSFHYTKARILQPKTPTMKIFRDGISDFVVIAHPTPHYGQVIFITFSSIPVMTKGLQWHFYHSKSQKRTSTKVSSNDLHICN